MIYLEVYPVLSNSELSSLCSVCGSLFFQLATSESCKMGKAEKCVGVMFTFHGKLGFEPRSSQASTLTVTAHYLSNCLLLSEHPLLSIAT